MLTKEWLLKLKIYIAFGIAVIIGGSGLFGIGWSIQNHFAKADRVDRLECELQTLSERTNNKVTKLETEKELDSDRKELRTLLRIANPSEETINTIDVLRDAIQLEKEIIVDISRTQELLIDIRQKCKD
mgnify:CR=1 FL=1